MLCEIGAEKVKEDCLVESLKHEAYGTSRRFSDPISPGKRSIGPRTRLATKADSETPSSQTSFIVLESLASSLGGKSRTSQVISTVSLYESKYVG